MKSMIPFWCLSVAVLGPLILAAQNVSGPGGKLAYVRGGDIWVKTLPDGESREISQGGAAADPQWSSSGEWLSYSQKGKLVVVPANGDREKALTFEPTVYVRSATMTWSPSQEEFAFIDQEGLWVVRLGENGPLRRLVLSHSVVGKITGFQWSPGGDRFAVSVTARLPGLPEGRVGRLWRVNADGSQAQQIFSAREPEEMAGGDLSVAGWSSDGQRILIWLFHEFSPSLVADGAPLGTVPANGGPARTLTQDVLVHPDSLAISPRKPEVVAVSGWSRESWTSKRLMLADIDSGLSTPLTDAKATEASRPPIHGYASSGPLIGAKSAVASPAWSPDGTWIAYVSGPDIGNVGGGEQAKKGLAQRRIWIMTADGTQARQLTSDPQYRDEYPLWSHDGRYVLFIRMDEQGETSIWSLDLNNGALRKLVDDIVGPERPAAGVAAISIQGRDNWFGYYGHIGWSRLMAWHQE